MITINNSNYKLILLDTCILSNFLKEDNNAFSNFMLKFFNDKNDKYIICYEPNVLLELKRNTMLFDVFKEKMKIFLAILLNTGYKVVQGILKNGSPDIMVYPLNNLYDNSFEIMINMFEKDINLINDIKKNEIDCDKTAIEWNKKREEFNNNFKKLNLNIKNRNKILNKLYSVYKEIDFITILKEYGINDIENIDIPDSIKIQSFVGLKRYLDQTKLWLKMTYMTSL